MTLRREDKDGDAVAVAGEEIERNNRIRRDARVRATVQFLRGPFPWEVGVRGSLWPRPRGSSPNKGTGQVSSQEEDTNALIDAVQAKGSGL